MATHLTYRDDRAFYAELKGELDEGNEVVIETDFRSEDEVPEKLAKIFRVQLVSGALTDATGMFVSGAVVGSSLNAKPLYVLAGAAAGAGVGAGVGTVAGGVGAGPGAAVGAAIGGTVGLVAAATAGGRFEVEIEVDTHGRLRIKIKPK